MPLTPSRPASRSRSPCGVCGSEGHLKLAATFAGACTVAQELDADGSGALTKDDIELIIANRAAAEGQSSM